MRLSHYLCIKRQTAFIELNVSFGQKQMQAANVCFGSKADITAPAPTLPPSLPTPDL